MSSNSFRKLRPLTCVSPAQSEQALCSAGNPQLRQPQPPAPRNPERIVTAREFVGVGGKTTQSVKLPPVFGSSCARELVPHPPAQRKTNTTRNFGICFLQHESDKRRQLSRSKFFLLEKEKALIARAKRLSEEESVLSRKQLEAEKTAADLEPYQRLSVAAPEAKKRAQDAIREQLKTQKEVEDLERKIRALKEELVLTETDKEFEEEISENELMDLEEKEMLEYMNFMDEMHEKDQTVKRLQEEKEKLKMKADGLMEKEKIMDRLIEQKEEKLKQIKYTLENLNSDGMWNTANSFKQVCEKMAEVYVEIFDRFCGTDFPLVMLQDFDDASLDLLEKIPAEKLHKIQMQHWKDYAVSDRLKKEAEWEAMQEQWRQKSLARSLAPAGKLIRRKLMPRSRPSQTVKKEEPLETKNQEYQHFLLNQFLS